MMIEVIAQTAEEARAAAKERAKREVYISTVSYVRGKPDVRAFVFTTEGG